MALKITVKGVVLTQKQVDAITPIMQERAALRHMSRAQFEARCAKAMQEAGCPLEEPVADLTEVSVGDLCEVAL